MTMESRTYMTCGLKIDTTSEGWHKCLTKMLKKIQGASYTVDADGGMAYVSGKVNPRKLIRRIVKAGKEAELSWVRTGSDQYSYGSNGNGYYEGVQGYDPNYIGATAPYYNYGQAGYYPPYGPHQGYYSQAPYAYNFY